MAVYLSKSNVGKVSVIIPFYNQAEFITDCIASLLSQTYTDWEAIIVDDGSDEDIPSFVSMDERVRVVEKANGGLSSARNKGISEAKGEYIQFLDADDNLHPEKFEAQIAGLQIHNADISISGYWAFKHPDLSNGVTSDTELKDNSPLEDFVTRWENGLCIPIHCFLYKRHVIDEVGGFDTTLPNHEDWDFHIRCAYKNFRYCHDPSKFALYRVHPKSMCRTLDMEEGKAMVVARHKGWNEVLDYDRIDLLNTTFIYCVKIDSPERLMNLDFAMDFMWKNFYTNIILIEEDTDSKITGRYRYVNHIFIESSDAIFHRTRLINHAVRKSTTDYFCNIDIDAFTDSIVYKQAVDLLTQNVVVYPYNGKFYDIPSYYAHNRLLHIINIDMKECGLVNPNSYGGIVFFRKKEFIEGGMENENFVSWGAEDNERYLRFKKLGYSVHRIDKPLFHFTHPRGVNSCEDNPCYRRGIEEYEKITMMGRVELREYVHTFTWTK